MSGLIEKRRNIWSSQQICDLVAEEHGINVKKQRVTLLLSRYFNMSFRTIRRANILGNEPRALVLRQHWAKVFLPLLESRKRVLIVDESWFTSLDQRRKKWAPRCHKNSVVQKELGRKVNIICGLDTDGRVYASIHQINTDESVFVTFLTKLAETLQKEDPQFR